MRAALLRLPLLLLLLGAGCVRPEPTPRFTPAWEHVDLSGPDWERTRPALLISDCQIHNLFSQALPERNLSAEAMAATAIRPPQLDLFGPDVLAWILANGSPDADVVLHLGDALDLACTGEFETFLGVMAKSPRPWFMAPGNHDFFYFGVYDPQDVGLWKSASHGAGEPLRKDEFIRRYVAVVRKQQDPGCAALDRTLGTEELPADFDWTAPDGTEGLLAAIHWHLDPKEPWRSFLLQAVDVTAERGFPARVYLLDSCQYQRRPELVPNAWKSWPLHLNCGFTGEMLPDQLRTLRGWLAARPPESSVFMCHHPFDNLAPRSKSSLGWLWNEYHVGMMVTAHTHSGYFAHHDLGGGFDEMELNLGSTTDWPMEWRTLVAFMNPQEQQIYIRAERHLLVDELRDREGYFEPGWEIPRDAPDDYRRYKQGKAAGVLLFDFFLAHHVVPYWMKQPRVKPNQAARQTEQQIKDTLLWTYVRLVETFPTAPGSAAQWPEGCTDDAQVVARITEVATHANGLEPRIELLQELAVYERTRTTTDDAARARWKLSQATWASRFEQAQGRRLRVEDDLIRVDWESAKARRAGEGKE